VAALSFATWLTTVLAPPWLRGAWGTKFLTVSGEQADRTATAAKDAVKAGFVESTPSDGLGYAGRGRNIERYTQDTDDTYRARLLDAWAVWELAGTGASIVAKLVAQGYPGAQLYNAVQLVEAGYTVPPAWVGYWSVFWVALEQPHSIHSDGLWGDPGTWGDSVTTQSPGPGTWGSDASIYRVRETRDAVRKWKEAKEICANIAVRFNSDPWTLAQNDTERAADTGACYWRG
jgi:hypothetical protein